MPHTYLNLDGAVRIVNASGLSREGRQKQESLLEPYEPASLAYTAVNKKIASLKQGEQ